jgi:hypothetical protein
VRDVTAVQPTDLDSAWLEWCKHAVIFGQITFPNGSDWLMCVWRTVPAAVAQLEASNKERQRVADDRIKNLVRDTVTKAVGTVCVNVTLMMDSWWIAGARAAQYAMFMSC